MATIIADRDRTDLQTREVPARTEVADTTVVVVEVVMEGHEKILAQWEAQVTEVSSADLVATLTIVAVQTPSAMESTTKKVSSSRR